MEICFFHHQSPFTSFAYLWYVNVHMTVMTAFFFRITVYVLLYTLLRTSAIWNHD